MSTRTRLLQVQRGFYDRLRTQLKKQRGPMPRSQRDYAERYRREFRSSRGVVSTQELIDEVRLADVVMCGDYHTLGQAQKTVLRILRRVLPDLRSKGKRVILALEMLRPSDSDFVSAYLFDELPESDLLRKIDFKHRWGVGWSAYRRLMRAAHRMGVEIQGLSTPSPQTLAARDRYAADRLSEMCERPDTVVFVLFGDLHLAAGHLPKSLKRSLAKRGLKRRAVVIHQNAEGLYWKFAKEARWQERALVTRLGVGRFCIVNTPPWIKLHSYSQWLEKNKLSSSARFSELHEAPIRSWLTEKQIDRESVRRRLEAHATDDGTQDEIDYTGELRDILCEIGKVFALPAEGSDRFSLAWPSDPSFLDRIDAAHGFGAPEIETLLHRIGAFDTLFIPRENLLFMGSLNFNRAVHEASVALFATSTGVAMPLGASDERFYVTVWLQALGFLGSKVYNPNRKCAGVSDVISMAQGFRSGSFGQKICLGAKIHLEAEAANQFKPFSLRRLELVSQQLEVNHSYFIFEVASVLGRMMGQALFSSILHDDFKALSLDKILAAVSDPPLAARAYFEWSRALDAKGYRDFSQRESL